MKVAKLSEAQLEQQLATLSDWELADGKLHRRLVFKDFVEAFEFMGRVARIAEDMNHHPEWSNVYNRVVVDLVTHDAGGITELDFELASRVEEIATALRASR